MSHYPGAGRHRLGRFHGRIGPREIAWAVLAGLVACLVPVLAMVNPAPASAQVLGPGTPSIPGFSGYVLSNNGELGIGRLPNGKFGVCTDTGNEFPWPSSPTVSMVSNPRIAYALGKYVGPARSNGRLAAALWWAVGLDFGQNSHAARVRAYVDQLASENPPVFADVKVLHDRIVSDAGTNASPAGGFTFDLALAEEKAHTGTVTGVGVQGVGGGWADGFDVTLTLTGPATFDATGTKTWTGVTGDVARSVAWTQSGPGPVTVSGTVSGLPDTRYERWWGGGDTQRVLAAADLVSVSDEAQVADDTGWARARKVDVETAAPLAGAVFRAWGEVPPGVDGVRAADEPSRDMTTNANGYTGRFDWFKGSQGVSRVCFREIKAPVGYAINRTVACVTATGSTAEVTVEDRVRTTAAGSWLPLTVVKTAEGNDPTGLLGVSIEVRADSPAGPVVDSYTFGPGDIAVSGQAGHTFPASPGTCSVSCRFDEAGDYYVAITTEPPGWSPASQVVQASMSPDGTGFTAQLDDRKVWVPELATQVSAQHVVPGETISDRVTVTATGGHELNGSWSLLGPVAPVVKADTGELSCAGLDWSSASVTATGSFSISGDGDYQVGEHQVVDPGCYTYTESVESTDLTQAVSPTSPGIPAETTLAVHAPALTTQVSEQMVHVGETIHDQVAVTGTGGTSVTGQWRLLGPVAPAVAPAGRTCAGVDWTSAPVAAEGEFTAAGDGTYTVGEHLVTAAGCYTYTENLAGTTSSLPLPTTQAGIPSETTLATTGPTLVTQVSDQLVTLGETITDQVVVAGTGGATVTGEWQLLGPLAPDVEADGPVRGIVRCTGLDWASAPIAAQGELTVPGDGTYAVGEYLVQDAGCYTYTESLPETGTTEAVATTPGIPAETTVAVSQPDLVTRISDRTSDTGDTISDTVEVTGTQGASTRGRWRLLGPVATLRDGSCDGVEWRQAAVVAEGRFDVTGDGSYTVGEHTVEVAGCYTYTESLAGTAATMPVPWTEAGIPAETTLAAPVPVAPDDSTTAMPPDSPRIEAGGGAGRRRNPWLLLAGLAAMVTSVAAAVTFPVVSRHRRTPGSER